MLPGLFERSPQFRDFAANVGVVPTRSVQMWCDKTTFEMGWKTGKAATVSGPDSLNIWADMTQVMAFEVLVGAIAPVAALSDRHLQHDTVQATCHRRPGA